MIKKITIILFLCISFFNFEKKEIHNTTTNYKETKFVTAESGLLCRAVPNGKVIHKFAYGMEVEIIETTNQKLTINDNGKEISGNWVKVRINNTNKVGYVFDGFLTSQTQFDLDVEKIAKLTPAQYTNTTNSNGLILKGIHNIYDEDLHIINQITIDSISEIKILSISKFERPITREKAKRKQWQEYCKWANYVKIIYKNKKLILFGKNILSITKKTPRSFKGSNINFVKAKNFLKKSFTLTEELSDCYSGSYLMIEANKHYSFITNDRSRLSFEDDENGCEGENVIIKNDTLYFNKINYYFQTGYGDYKIKMFNKHSNWNYIIYDLTKTYTD